MNFLHKTFKISVFLTTVPLFSSCALVERAQKQEISYSAQTQANLQVALSQYKQSKFKQVEATFLTQQSKELVFRVLSDIDQTAQWLQRLDSVDVVTVYNNHQYLLRTVINSLWPFKNRELITCVDTFFEEQLTTINIYSCSDRVPMDDINMRLLQVESSWKIKKISDSVVEVNYKTWIDPAGFVPAFIFNGELIDNTEADLIKLQTIIDNASLEQYSY